MAGGAIALVAMAFDVWSKSRWFGSETVILPRVLALTAHENNGLLFDIPCAWQVVSMVTALLLIGLLAYAIRASLVTPLMLTIGLWLIIGGGLGNLYDRLAFHFVRDWLLLFGRSAFNVADVCVLLGVALLSLQHFRSPHAT